MPLPLERRRRGRTAVGRGLLLFSLGCAALLSAFPARGAEEAVDTVTAASVDATTGASKQLEPVRISDKFSVAYAENDDGSLFITAGDLADAYGRDELSSDSLFKEKAMVIKGTVEKTSKADAAKPWLTLAGPKGSAKKVRCSLKAGQLAGRDIAAGRVVQIRGVCEGMKLNVAVIDAEIID